ncbi:MAG: glycosyl hydrolase [Victivallales bacterium]
MYRIKSCLTVMSVMLSATCLFSEETAPLRDNYAIKVYCDSPAGEINHLLLGVAPGGNALSFTKPDVVKAISGIGLKMARLEGVTGDPLGCPALYDPATGKYNWIRLDTEIEAMQANGIEIIANLEYCPRFLGDTSKGWWGHPPVDNVKWAKYVYDIVYHVNIEKKYGVKYWEFWNEASGGLIPQIGYRKFFDWYAVTAKAVKDADPNALVTGLGGDSAKFPEHYREFFKYAKANNVPVDFITYHWYADWELRGQLRPELYFQYSNALSDLYNGFFGKRCPIFITEWNYNSEAIGKTSPASQTAFIAAALYWMQQSRLTGACFFRIEYYRGFAGNFIDRQLLNKDLKMMGPARVFKMFSMLPKQRIDARWDSSDLTVLAARENDIIATMVSRNGGAGDIIGLDYSSNPVKYVESRVGERGRPATLKAELLGLEDGQYEVTIYLEDAGSAGSGELKPFKTLTVKSSKHYASIDLEMKGDSVALIAIRKGK